MRQFILFILFILTYGANGIAQTKQTVKWQKVSDDEIVTISYNPNITNTKSGNHIVWVKAEYHTSEWQWYFAEQIGLRTPIYTTKTKVWYDENYNYCMVRQILLFNKAGKQVYNSGEDGSAGWGPVNASDPVGIVGEYIGSKLPEAMEYYRK